MAYCDVQQLFDTVIPFGQHRCYWKSRYLSGLDDAAIDAIVAGNAAPAVAEHAVVDLELRRAPRPTSTPTRRRSATARCRGWSRSTRSGTPPTRTTANIAWTRAFWERLEPYSDRGRIYLNFAGHGEDNDELTRRAFGPNYQRLARDQAALRPDQHVPLQPEHPTGDLSSARSRSDIVEVESPATGAPLPKAYKDRAAASLGLIARPNQSSTRIERSVFQRLGWPSPSSISKGIAPA